MRPQFSGADLDAEVVFDRYLALGHELDALQDVLVAVAPRWCSKLRVWREPRDQRPVDTARAGALREAVLAEASERGATYEALVRQYGTPPLERVFGSAELRGSSGDLVVVVGVDELVLSPLGDRKNLGNSVHLQMRGSAAARQPRPAWLHDVFGVLCERMSPAWGWAGCTAEYWAKVMSDSPPVQAVGRDFGRHLPGLFWLNFFGHRLCELVGDARLRSTPAHLVQAMDTGVLIALAGDPEQWHTPDYRAVEERARRHIGEELFYTGARAGLRGVALAWGG